MNIYWTATSELSFVDREEMYLLSSIHFENVNRDAFDWMIDQKTWVLLLRDSLTSDLTAFVPFCFYQSIHSSECHIILDSNEVVADPKVWPGLGLASAWVAVMNSLRRLCAPQQVHWIFLCGHPRIYRLLSRFWQCYYPQPGIAMPATQQACLRSLLAPSGSYKGTYNEDTGIMPSQRLLPLRRRWQRAIHDCSDLYQAEQIVDERTAFFVTQNPHYEQGDRLVCWIDIDVANLTPQGRRYSNPRQAARLKTGNKPAGGSTVTLNVY